tara:strand:+ start:403 stop:651 length:249 start_codon:yes stop_codon:yes gene_type:complete
MLSQNSKLYFILRAAFHFFIGANVVMFLFYFYEDNWQIGENIQKMYLTWKVVYNPLIYLSLGALYGWNEWRKKVRKIAKNNK